MAHGKFFKSRQLVETASLNHILWLFVPRYLCCCNRDGFQSSELDDVYFLRGIEMLKLFESQMIVLHAEL